MAIDEVQGYLADEVPWSELSIPARIFLGNLLGDRDKTEQSASRIRDHRAEADQSGPFNRISAMLDALSGENSEWVTSAELAASIATEDVLAAWIAGVAKLANVDEKRIIELTIDTWSTFELDGALPTEFVIDVSFDDDGPVWRTVRAPLTLPAGLAATFVELLVRDHAGKFYATAVGRTQVTLPDLEVFVGTENDPRTTGLTLVESPVVLSAICGMELRPPDDESMELAIKVFLADPKTPGDLKIEITEGVGVQLWLDRLVSTRSLALAEPADLLDGFILESRRLAEALTPWEHNPAGAG
jgi:hypothetical protein